MNVICLVIDRLHPGYLGAYGNAWVETPAVDRLASQALVFDQVLSDSPHLASVYRSYWHGLHAMCAPRANDPQTAGRPSLAAQLRAAGVATALLTDEPQVIQHPLAADFDELIEIDPPWQPRTAIDLDETHFARCFVELIEWLDDAPGPFLLWSHLGGLGTTWDAPLEFRRAYQEPGDPDPPEGAEVPDRLLPPDCDPDVILGLGHAYAGQVSLFDSCLGALLESLASSALGRETLMVLTSPRGLALGEHHRVGPAAESLYGELLHVPLIVRWPDGRAAGERSLSLVEPADLWATLLEAFGVPPPPSPTAFSLLPIVTGDVGIDGRERWPRDRLCATAGSNCRAIRTPAWFLREDAAPELFVKPDDRSEVNNVALRCQEVAECLQDAIVEFEQTVQSGAVGDLPALNDVLLEGLG